MRTRNALVLRKLLCTCPAGALLMTKQENPPSPGNWLTGLLRGAGQAPGDALLDLITKFVDPDSNHRIYIGTVKVGETMFHCHSAVHELQVRPAISQHTTITHVLPHQP